MGKITKTYHANRRSPFQVSWIEKGKRISRFFDTEDARDEFLKEYSFLENQSFQGLMSIDSTAIADIARIETLRGTTSYRELWEFWAKHHQNRVVMKLWDACDAYLRDMIQNEKANTEHIRHVRRILEALVEVFGERLVEDVAREELEKWLSSLPYSPVTKRNYRSTLCASWNWFEKHNLIDKNIAKSLDCPAVDMGEIGFLSVAETEQLMRANEKIDPEICGLMALGLFAGMRTSAIARVAFEEISMRKGILTPAEKTKKKRRDYIENLPDNLWAWLERTPQTAFGWCERKFKKRRESAFRRAGLLVNAQDVKRLAEKGVKAKLKLPPHNAFRHSFASYHVAWKRNFQDTALILSHKATDILFKHYRGNATKENAEKYFNIYPSNYQKD